MNTWIAGFGMALSAYLVGAIPFGLLFSRSIEGVDPRERGSGNIGATNVLRVVGKRAAALTLVCDILKGAVPVAVVRYFGMGEEILLIVSLAVVLGHIFPIYLRFKGGKGVATAFGMFLALSPQIAFIAAIFWLGGFLLSKYAAVAALTAFGVLPFISFFLTKEPMFILFASSISLLVCIRHKDNIRRLMNGTEKEV
ncbi:MAG: glycerol-3-phosphate 1-O-acyltransferase PlsY [Nitrospira sp.]|nr:glycerol-3-phosphate 1-O-acyltransferase PlsY [Candidatus Manganitrophaceae bacterium]HIL34636.1 glycerol-3-phosphate 1-O-acyltransferase [Candidatus Manganitrophaceae bacterium]